MEKGNLFTNEEQITRCFWNKIWDITTSCNITTMGAKCGLQKECIEVLDALQGNNDDKSLFKGQTLGIWLPFGPLLKYSGADCLRVLKGQGLKRLRLKGQGWP